MQKYNVTCIVFQLGLGITFPLSALINMTWAEERGRRDTQVEHFIASLFVKMDHNISYFWGN